MSLFTRRQALGGAAVLGVASLAAPRAPATPREPGVREHWIAAVPRRWEICPSGRDELRDRRIPRVSFDGLSYVTCTPGFAHRMPRQAIGDNAGMPGPVLRASPGDTLVVHFRNEDRRTHTMHPHGVRYAPEFDGSFMGRFTPPGGRVKPGETFTYRWEVGEDAVGVWPYHDHGPHEMVSTDAGLFGAIVITPREQPAPDLEVTLVLHHLNPDTTGSDMAFAAINGRAFAGNTPTVRAKAGQDVAFNVLVMGTDFHTFHIHGHRWPGAAGNSVDSPTLGPGEGLRARFREDAPGRWLYHCHVAHHMHQGMIGFYVVQ